MTQAVVFLDLGGTLLQSDGTVDQTSLAAIKALQQQDILPVLATGKAMFAIAPLMKQTGITSAVSANGSFLQYLGKRLDASVIPTAMIEVVNDFAAKHGDPVAWYTNSGCALSAASADTAQSYAEQGLKVAVDPSWYLHHKVNFLFVFNRDRDGLYQQAFANELSFVRNSAYGLDTVRAGVSKARGIETLLRHAGLTHVPTYGFGDSLNDLVMLEQLDHPIAMGNASDAAKARAEYVTADHDHQGIVEGLRHFGLIA